MYLKLTQMLSAADGLLRENSAAQILRRFDSRALPELRKGRLVLNLTSVREL
jgi:hypothetical protein